MRWYMVQNNSTTKRTYSEADYTFMSKKVESFKGTSLSIIVGKKRQKISFSEKTVAKARENLTAILQKNGAYSEAEAQKQADAMLYKLIQMNRIYAPDTRVKNSRQTVAEYIGENPRQMLYALTQGDIQTSDFTKYEQALLNVEKAISVKGSGIIPVHSKASYYRPNAKSGFNVEMVQHVVTQTAEPAPEPAPAVEPASAKQPASEPAPTPEQAPAVEPAPATPAEPATAEQSTVSASAEQTTAKRTYSKADYAFMGKRLETFKGRSLSVEMNGKRRKINLSERTIAQAQKNLMAILQKNGAYSEAEAQKQADAMLYKLIQMNRIYAPDTRVKNSRQTVAGRIGENPRQMLYALTQGDIQTSDIAKYEQALLKVEESISVKGSGIIPVHSKASYYRPKAQSGFNVEMVQHIVTQTAEPAPEPAPAVEPAPAEQPASEPAKEETPATPPAPTAAEPAQELTPAQAPTAEQVSAEATTPAPTAAEPAQELTPAQAPTAETAQNATEFGQELLALLSKGAFDEERALSLINAGADLSMKNEDGKTALHRAVEHGNEQVVNALIAKGIDVYATDNDGNSALHFVGDRGSKTIVNALIDAGSVVSMANASGDTPLHMAVVAGNKQVVEALIAKRADVAKRNLKRETPIHLAAKYADAETIRTFLTYNYALRYNDASGNTFFDILRERLNSELAGKNEADYTDAQKALLALEKELSTRKDPIPARTELNFALSRVPEPQVTPESAKEATPEPTPTPEPAPVSAQAEVTMLEVPEQTAPASAQAEPAPIPAEQLAPTPEPTPTPEPAPEPAPAPAEQTPTDDGVIITADGGVIDVEDSEEAIPISSLPDEERKVYANLRKGPFKPTGHLKVKRSEGSLKTPQERLKNKKTGRQEELEAKKQALFYDSFGEALIANDLAKIDAIIADGFDINWVDKETGVFPLLDVVVHGKKETVEHVINHYDVDLNKCSPVDNSTALMLAVEMGRADVVELLLSKNVNLNVVRSDGKTAYDIALQMLKEESESKENLYQIADLLHQSGGQRTSELIRKKYQSAEGKDEMIQACLYGDKKDVAILLQHYPGYINNIDKTNNLTPLMASIERGDLEIFDMVMDANPDLNMISRDEAKGKRTALDVVKECMDYARKSNDTASYETYKTMWRLLLEKGAKTAEELGHKTTKGVDGVTVSVQEERASQTSDKTLLARLGVGDRVASDGAQDGVSYPSKDRGMS